MRPQTIKVLRDLNRVFYDTFADAFDASRARTEPGLMRILPEIAPGSHVLDLGCGQGRLAALLPQDCRYIGIDNSEAMLALARTSVERQDLDLETHFTALDLTDSSWTADVPGPFDWIIMRAVLHHIPAYAHRCRLLRQTATLLKATGRILVANWQFLEIQRLQRRVLPWSEIGLKPTDIEPGDYLLDWKRDGYGRRYVHLIEESETQALAQESSLKLCDMFRADGHTHNLTLYATLSVIQKQRTEFRKASSSDD
jgi:SAM-dependent methyltransferase